MVVAHSGDSRISYSHSSAISRLSSWRRALRSADGLRAGPARTAIGQAAKRRSRPKTYLCILCLRESGLGLYQLMAASPIRSVAVGRASSTLLKTPGSARFVSLGFLPEKVADIRKLAKLGRRANSSGTECR